MRGLYVPLYGNFTIKARVGATDIMTIEGAGSTGDFIVCRDSAGTEVFVVEDDGSIATPTVTCSLTVTKSLTVGADASTTCALTVGKALTVTAGDVTVTAGDVVITNGYFLRFTSWPLTNVLSAVGLTQGDVWLQKTSSFVQLAIAQSTSVIRYINTVSVST